ncbi:RNase P [[Pantoea] beijingensis]|uniref:RNase P n=1 Tax=[Pantoea] beijingensis TaxID=1324864 RepID=A0A443IH01_9GAMM|nr:RNase P [[Pantoea] beijingensis]
MLSQAKAFAGQSLDPVTLMRTLNIFFSDGKTDAGMPQPIIAAENGNLRHASPLWLLEDESEMSGS